ncbi:MAG: hypothetical protein AAB308_04015 [Nitrospirota bacterium]
MRRSPRTGRAVAMVKPSRKARTRIRQAIRERTTRAQFSRLLKVVIAAVNSRVRGWVQ